MSLDAPCEHCGSHLTGPDHVTPHGLCEECACGECRGFKATDDKGFLLVGQVHFSKVDCKYCGGTGLKNSLW